MRSLMAIPLALALQAPPVLEAQERGWRLGVIGEAGFIVPTRSLGNNSTEVGEATVLQVTTDFESAPWVGAGLQLDFPAREVRVRGVYRRTVGAESSSRLVVCGDEDEPTAGGALCVPVESDASLETMLVDISVPRGSPTSVVRPVLHLGLGLRKYSFGFDEATCDDPGDWRYVCALAAGVWADDGGLSPFLNFGLGFTSEVGPVRLYGEALTNAGPYRGGAEGADGNLQVDVSFDLGLALTIF